MLFVQAPNAWLDGTCHFPSPGLRDNGIFFFKNPNPVLPTDAGQLPVALTASIRRTRGWLGIKRGASHEHQEHHDFFTASQHPELLLFGFICIFCPGVTSTVKQPLASLAPCFVCPFSVSSRNRISARGKHCVTLDRTFPFWREKGRVLSLLRIFFPFFGVTSGLLFGGFWGILSEQAAQHCWVYWTAYLKDVMMSGCHLWTGVIPARGFPGITKLSRGWT